MLVCDLNYRHGTQQRKFGCRSYSEICQHLHGTESLIVCGIIKEDAFNKNKYLGQGLGNRNCKGWLEEESSEKEWNKCRRKFRHHKLNRNKEKRVSGKRECSTLQVIQKASRGRNLLNQLYEPSDKNIILIIQIAETLQRLQWWIFKRNASLWQSLALVIHKTLVSKIQSHISFVKVIWTCSTCMYIYCIKSKNNAQAPC